MKNTLEQNMIIENLEDIGVSITQKQLDMIENVYSERIKEQKTENIIYRLINVGLGVLLLFLTSIAYCFAAGFYPFFLMTVYFTGTQFLNLLKLINDYKKYKKRYATRVLHE